MHRGLARLHVPHVLTRHHLGLTRHHLPGLLTHHRLARGHLASDHHLTSLHLHLLLAGLPRGYLAPDHLPGLHLHLLLGGRPHGHPEAWPRRPHKPVLHLHGLGLRRGPHAWLGGALPVHWGHVATHGRGGHVTRAGGHRVHG